MLTGPHWNLCRIEFAGKREALVKERAALNVEALRVLQSQVGSGAIVKYCRA